MQNRRITLALALASCLWAGGCNRSDKPRIGVVPKAVAHVFWQSVHAGAAKAAAEEGVEIEWKGPPAETDFARQIEIVDSMITARLDGIVLAPTEATSLVGVVERAAREGVPVTIFDTDLNSDEYVSFVATDNHAAGAMAARKLAELLGGKGSVAVVKMVPGSGSTTARELGFEETLAAEFPEIVKVAEQYCMSDRAKARAVTENMMTAHPDLDAVFASAEPATVGAAQAVKGREDSEGLVFVGFDSGDTIEADLRSGVIDALIVQDPFNIGYQAVKTIVAKRAGGTPAKRIDSPAFVVTLENVDEPEIAKVLHPDLSSIQ